MMDPLFHKESTFATPLRILACIWTVCTLLFVFSLIGLVSCGRRGSVKDYVPIVQSGIKILPWPSQMESLFGDADHFILSYGLPGDHKVWHSTVFFYGRYEMTLETSVEIDYKHKTVKNVASPPKFYLHEVKSIVTDNGRPSAIYSEQWVIGDSKWKKLVASKGNWSTIGIYVKTNDPVPGFAAFVMAARAPIERIPH